MNQQEFKWKISEDNNEPVALITIERTGTHIDAVSLFEPRAPIDERRWRIIPKEDGSLTLQLWNDAETVCEVMHIKRVGTRPV